MKRVRGTRIILYAYITKRFPRLLSVLPFWKMNYNQTTEGDKDNRIQCLYLNRLVLKKVI